MCSRRLATRAPRPIPGGMPGTQHAQLASASRWVVVPRWINLGRSGANTGIACVDARVPKIFSNALLHPFAADLKDMRSTFETTGFDANFFSRIGRRLPFRNVILAWSNILTLGLLSSEEESLSCACPRR